VLPVPGPKVNWPFGVVKGPLMKFWCPGGVFEPPLTHPAGALTTTKIAELPSPATLPGASSLEQQKWGQRSGLTQEIRPFAWGHGRSRSAG
jgi:hypothetical protein